MSELIIFLIDDLMFAPRLEQMARHAGYQTFTTTNEVEMAKAMVNAPILIVVDIGATTFHWRKLVKTVRGPMKKNNHVPVLGFGPHIDLALRDEALDLGCTAVVGRSAITGNLPSLIDKHRWRIDEAYCAETPPALVLQGIDEFNQARFFQCHETLEDAWNEEQRPVRVLYQGILQIGVGYLHLTRHNWRGAVKVFERGIPKIAHFQPVCQGIEVSRLLAEAQATYRQLRQLGPDGIEALSAGPFPQIKVIVED